MRRAVMLLVLLVSSLMVGCSLGTESDAEPTSVWGGPYSARTCVGKDLQHVEAVWEDGELLIPDLPMPQVISFSIELDPGVFEWGEGCFFYPDPHTNSQGDLNAVAENFSFEFEKPGWGALVILPGVEDCDFHRVSE